MIERAAYMQKLNDLNENVAFWFDEGAEDPSLIVRQGDVELSVSPSGDISGIQCMY